ncbi:hypothetical protein OHAE_1766 [Ochrobactrum soli]|uniref:Uncharacterized protein n=1 Tax=Ochrobactrum soli TaxID=2448455 RepID=A0A2P9HPB8_9HYPH|nr:hypothetical protein OHAE_1766 [[Ochrobactrum] soli]
MWRKDAERERSRDFTFHILKFFNRPIYKVSGGISLKRGSFKQYQRSMRAIAQWWFLKSSNAG